MLTARTMALLAVAASLAVCVAAPSASAVTFRTGSAFGTVVPIGTTINGVGSNWSVSGTFVGISVTVVCNTTSFSGTVAANPGPTMAWANINSFTLAGCYGIPSAPNGCVINVTGLPWNPGSGGDTGGLQAPTTTSIRLGTGTAATNWIDVTDCMPQKTTCRLNGGAPGPATEGTFTLTNYVPGTWTSSSASAQAQFNGPWGIVNCPASGITWRADYRLTTSGNQVYLGT